MRKTANKVSACAVMYLRARMRGSDTRDGKFARIVIDNLSPAFDATWIGAAIKWHKRSSIFPRVASPMLAWTELPVVLDENMQIISHFSSGKHLLSWRMLPYLGLVAVEGNRVAEHH